MIHTTVFDSITMTKDLIDCNGSVNYKSFTDYPNLIIQKVAIEVIISFVAERFAIWSKRFGLIVPLIHLAIWLLVPLMHLDSDIQYNLV